MLLGNVRGFVEPGWSDGGTNGKTTDVWFRCSPTTADWVSKRRGGAKTRCHTSHPKSKILLPTQIPTPLKIDTNSSPLRLTNRKRSKSPNRAKTLKQVD